jgi:6-phosphogluconate dehydrogenase
MNMQIGLIGLGKMGGNMAERLRRDGHQVIGYDRNPASARDVDSLEALAAALSTPRVVWVMVPSGEPTRATIASLAEVVESGDIIIDGGNSRYTDDQAHAAALAPKGIHYLDVGVSGGIWGITEGYALMVGGEAEAVAIAQPIFDSLKPAGQQGTVIRSWLLELLVLALDKDPGLAEIRPYAQDSGEGRWTIEAAIHHAVPLPVITAALYARFASRQEDSPAMKVVAALRNQFGGHAVGHEGSTAPVPVS